MEIMDGNSQKIDTINGNFIRRDLDVGMTYSGDMHACSGLKCGLEWPSRVINQRNYKLIGSDKGILVILVTF